MRGEGGKETAAFRLDIAVEMKQTWRGGGEAGAEVGLQGCEGIWWWPAM